MRQGSLINEMHEFLLEGKTQVGLFLKVMDVRQLTEHQQHQQHCAQTQKNLLRLIENVSRADDVAFKDQRKLNECVRCRDRTSLIFRARVDLECLVVSPGRARVKPRLSLSVTYLAKSFFKPWA